VVAVDPLAELAALMAPGADVECEVAFIMERRPRWQAQGACVGQPLEVFFPERGQSSRQAIDLCRRCPVMLACRAWSLEQGTELVGVFGGWTGLQRRQAREGRSITEPGRKPGPDRQVAEHGSVTRYRQGCKCELCRAANRARRAAWEDRRAS